MKLSEDLKLRGAAVGDTYGRDGYGGTEVFSHACTIYNFIYLEELFSGMYDEGITFLWLVDENGNKKEKAIKLSEELRLRGVEVGDTYAYTRKGNAIPYTYRVYNSEFLKDLFSARHDEGSNFLWLVDKNGNKKEIIK